MHCDSRPYERLTKTPLSEMRILVTNDDGIYAPGLEVLESIARSLTDDVVVVAPVLEQSGAGHSLTINDPLRINNLGEHRYSVSGTPTDCVLMAVKQIYANDKPIDLVLSGVNRGANLGEDITYSGTVAAAMEGTLLDIPSIAISQLVDEKPLHSESVLMYMPGLIRDLVRVGWPPNVLLNINFPNLPPDQIRGVQYVPHGRRQVGERLTEHKDPKGRPYYWIGVEREDLLLWPGTDMAALGEGCISVTPLSLDMTAYKVLEQFRRHAGDATEEKPETKGEEAHAAARR